MNPQSSPYVSVITKHIGAGILGDIYGLEDISKTCTSITCLWLLHGRSFSKEQMKPFATRCLKSWTQRAPADSEIGLIAVAIDQRNHGTRLVYEPANGSWRDGNETHAHVFHGTATDTSLLIDHLGSYIFRFSDAPVITQHFSLGFSLGGHASWQLFFNEPRVTASVVIVGCPDYACIMSDRARLSKRETSVASTGTNFFGSEDFPQALVASVQKYDPKGMLFGASDVECHPSASERKRLRGQLDAKIKNKRLLLCSGAVDRLVPYHCAEPFIGFLKTATTGWYEDGSVYVEDNVYEGVGHEYTEAMIVDITRFISDSIAGSVDSTKAASKI
ncbi:hypothetical protein BJ878DRAFT_541434 [Calycina marina]|uniref:Uncharacterized protein n=1 Tax=Calycina marina TaxID=1763456 RepID=A0A9P8CHA8_9HELO|nr:hypothetical protein BJ878DRAFT_541434 [Calycina marina]